MAMNNKNTPDHDQSNAPEQPAQQAPQGQANAGKTTEESFPFEEKVWLFWEKYRNWIVIGIAAAVIGIAGTQIDQYLQEKRIEEQQNAYLQSIEQNTNDVFSEKYPKSALSGLTRLSKADDTYSEKQYETSLQHYKKAKNAFSQPLLKQRARIGMALSQYQLGNTGEATTLLDQAAYDPKNEYQALRAEALYHLSVINLDKGEFSAAEAHLNEIEAMEQSGIWSTRARLLRERSSKLTNEGKQNG